jgi:hypothetical protein
MAYSSGVAVDQDALMTALEAFALAEGWTIDDGAAGNNLSISKGTIYVQFRWDDTNHIAIFQSTGYLGSGPGYEPGDSGNGDRDGPITSGRRLSDIGAGPFTRYHFFSPTSGEDYIHVVLEFSPGIYRHMTFGELVKVGTWTGGEYCFGQIWDLDPVTISDDPTVNSHVMPFEGRFSLNSGDPGTIHVEDLPGQDPSGVWGVVWSGTSAGNDRGGNPRENIVSGVRAGFLGYSFSPMPANPANGFVPLIPIQVYHRQDAYSPERWRLLGYAPDMRVINLKHLAVGDEFTVGTDTWMVFPWCRKRHAKDDTQESWNAGFAYKKNT